MGTPTKPEPWRAPKKLPVPIVTERLEIRPFQFEDAEALLDAVASSRGVLLPWLPWAEVDNRNLAECIYNIERFRRSHAEPNCPDYVLGIFERDGGMLLGGTGLHRLILETHQGETGYWMRADRRNRGYITEACAAVVTSALTPQQEGGWGLRRMTILCSTENGASAAVPRKLGIPLEQRIRLDRWIDGVGFTGTLGFGVLCDEWDFARQRAQPGAMARSLDR